MLRESTFINGGNLRFLCPAAAGGTVIMKMAALSINVTQHLANDYKMQTHSNL